MAHITTNVSLIQFLFQPYSFMMLLHVKEKGCNNNIHIQVYIYIWVFPKIMVPPNHPFDNGVFHYLHHPFWESNPPIFGSTPIYIYIYRNKNGEEVVLAHGNVVVTLTLIPHNWQPILPPTNRMEPQSP